MAATQYQILYRVTNTNSGTYINCNNSFNADISQMTELYHSDHKIQRGGTSASGSDQKAEAEYDKNEKMLNGNNSDNPKYQQLYEYVGTKRLYKKTWVDSYEGYVIRDWSKIKDKITNTNYGSEDGDYSGDYLLFEGDTPENGVVVAKKNPMLGEYKATNGEFRIVGNSEAVNGTFYTIDEIKDILTNSTIAEIDWVNHPLNISMYDVMNGPTKDYFNYGHIPKDTGTFPHPEYYYNLVVKIGPNATWTPSTMSWQPSITYQTGHTSSTTIYNAVISTNFENWILAGAMACTYVKLNATMLKRYTIPSHWEMSTDKPYIIHDEYKPITQEPWFIYYTTGSFDKALERATALVDKIGLENVKMIKVVPTDQFIKVI